MKRMKSMKENQPSANAPTRSCDLILDSRPITAYILYPQKSTDSLIPLHGVHAAVAHGA
jgi:hypothetical protein